MNPKIKSLLKKIYHSRNSYYDVKSGRSVHHVPSNLTPDDLVLLHDCDLAPNTFVQIPHDIVISNIQKYASKISLAVAADAFVSCMGQPDWDWLPVLPALCYAQHLPKHSYLKEQAEQNRPCHTCFYRNEATDKTLAYWFRNQQGAGFDDTLDGPINVMFTLEWASQQPIDSQPKAKNIDKEIFGQFMQLLNDLPPNTRYSSVKKILKETKILNKNDAYGIETLLEALSVIGVLATPEFPGLFTKFTTASHRDQRPNTRVEVPAPLAWWSSDIGVDWEIFEQVFGHVVDAKHIKAGNFNLPNIVAINQLGNNSVDAAKIQLNKATQTKPKRKELIPQIGDVFAVKIREGLWSAIYCHEVSDEGKTRRCRIEWLDWLGKTKPTEQDIHSVNFKDRKDGRYQAWCSSLGKASGVLRIAEQVSNPEPERELPDRIPYCGAGELWGLAHWHFDF